jgi:hypothetical protein
VTELTFNEHGAEMMKELERQIDECGRSEAGRDLALSRTHLEDALTRYNSAQYRKKGTWKRADPDKALD